MGGKVAFQKLFNYHSQHPSLLAIAVKSFVAQQHLEICNLCIHMLESLLGFPLFCYPSRCFANAKPFVFSATV